MERVFSPAVSRRTLLQGTAAAGSSLLLPHGAFAQDMRGVVEKDDERLKQLAHIAALSLDPCVAYAIEVQDA